MDNKTWNEKKTLIEGWFEAHPDWEENVSLIAVPQLVAAGDAKPDTRKALYAAIRTCFADIADKPFRAGRGSSMPSEVIVARDSILSAYHSSMVDLFDSSEAVQALMLNAAYKAHTDNNGDAPYSWDGTAPVALVCNIVVEDDE